MMKQPELEVWLNRGLSWACLPLVIASAFALSTITWLVLAPSMLEPAPAQTSFTTVVSNTTPAPLDINSLTSWQLFGAFQATAVATSVQEEAPETRLSLELAGVFVAADPKKSTAVIMEKGREAQLFAIDDELPGNAQLQYVYADRVVIKRNGRFETLRFPKEVNSQQSISMNELLRSDTAEASADAGVREAGVREISVRNRGVKKILETAQNESTQKASPEGLVQTLQSGLQNNAEATLDQLGLESVDAGSGGYRVTSKTPPQLMAMLGLKSGDVLMSVNGNPIGNVIKDRSLFDQVMADGQATVSVKRGERTIKATVPIPKGLVR